MLQHQVQDKNVLISHVCTHYKCRNKTSAWRPVSPEYQSSYEMAISVVGPYGPMSPAHGLTLVSEVQK